MASAQPDLSPLQRPSRPMIEAAQAHYLKSGARFFESGQYDAALVEFEAAWRLSGEPDLLQQSWTHEKAGHIKEALDYALRYQAAVPTGEDQERARRRVEFLRQRYSTAPAPSEPAAASSTPVVSPAQVPASAPSPAREPSKTEARTKIPPLALGLVAGGGALAAAGNRLSGGRVGDGQQLGSADLAYSDAASLLDRGRASTPQESHSPSLAGAAVVGGAISWAVLVRGGLK